MHHRTAISRVLPVALFVLFLPSAIHAQSPQIPEHCQASQPVPDEETKARLESGQPIPEIVVDSVGLENPSDIPPDIRPLLVAAVREHTLCNTSSCVNELNEVGLRGVLQTNGYFRADTKIKVQVLSSDSTSEHISLTIHVDPGPQYYLGTVQFRSADPNEPLVFPVEELRQLIDMREGDIFDTLKLRHAFGELMELYGSQGYIDFTPMPDFDIDDQQHRLNLTLVLNQQPLYRIGRIEFVGDNPAAEQVVRTELIPGEPVDSRVLQQLGVKNYSLAKNVARGLVDIKVDFRPCPNATSAPNEDIPSPD